MDSLSSSWRPACTLPLVVGEAHGRSQAAAGHGSSGRGPGCFHGRGVRGVGQRIVLWYNVLPSDVHSIDVGVIDIYAARTWTETVRNVDPAKDPATLISLANMRQDLNATVWDLSTHTINECCTAYINEESGIRPQR